MFGEKSKTESRRALGDFLFDRLKRWRYGVRRISAKQIGRLAKKPRGFLMEAIPQAGPVNAKSIPNVFTPLLSLRYTEFSFEIWKFFGEIRFYFHSSNKIGSQAVKQFNAIYPKAVFRECEDFPKIKAGDYVSASTLRFRGKPFRLRKIQDFSYDPLAHLLQQMRVPANFIFQVVFAPVRLRGGSPAFEAFIRIVTIANNSFRAREANELLAASLSVLNTDSARLSPRFVSFAIPVVNDPLSVLKDVLKRKFPFFARGILLGKEELACLVHLPVSVEMPEIEYTRLKFDGGSSVLLGHSRYGGEEVRAALEEMKNIHVPGMPGVGKSVFLANLALQAFEAGRCCHVIDPHGDLALELLKAVAPERIKDVVFLDPTKIDFSLNPLELDAKEGRELAIETTIGEITEMMKGLFGRAYWGPSMNRTFQNALRALYSTGTPTFEDLLKVLQKQDDFGSPEIKQFQREVGFLSRERIDAVVNKIDPFVKNKMLHGLFCRRKSSLDFSELTKEGRLVIWRLPKAHLTQPLLELIGTGIITKLWFWVVSRQERSPVLLMIDEFQIFSSLETPGIMLSEGRKYGLQLALAHQNLQQLRDRKVSVEDVFGNTQTKVIFRLSGYDASLMARTLDVTRWRDLVHTITNLPDGVALVKLPSGFGKRMTVPFEVKTPPPPKKRFHEVAALVGRMRERYAAKEEAQARTSRPPPDIMDVLKAVHETEVATVSELVQVLRKSGSSVSELLDQAESLGYLQRLRLKQKGKPRIVSRLTEKGQRALGIGISLGSGARIGGELHRSLILKIAARLRGEGYRVEFPKQEGEQPDLIAWPREGEDWGKPIAFEIETRGQHPEQVRKNFLKNVQQGRHVVFVVPDEGVKGRVLNALGEWVKFCRVYTEAEMGVGGDSG